MLLRAFNDVWAEAVNGCPNVTGTDKEIRAWLFLAAGILPTMREVEELGSQIPSIEGWPQPATVMDFGWTLWRANERRLRLAGRHRILNVARL